jgi:hypothetical protein
LRDRFQHISGLGDMRQVDLGPDLILGAGGPGGAGRSVPARILLGVKVLLHLGRFVRFQ